MTVSVRYIVADVDAAIAFYTGPLGFTVEMHPAPGFAALRPRRASPAPESAGRRRRRSGDARRPAAASPAGGTASRSKSTTCRPWCRRSATMAPASATTSSRRRRQANSARGSRRAIRSSCSNPPARTGWVDRPAAIGPPRSERLDDDQDHDGDDEERRQLVGDAVGARRRGGSGRAGIRGRERRARNGRASSRRPARPSPSASARSTDSSIATSARPRSQVAIIAGVMITDRSRCSITLKVSDFSDPVDESA